LINQEKFCDILIIESLLKYAKIYGIEGLEQVIKNLYCNMPVLRDRVLKIYNEIILDKKY